VQATRPLTGHNSSSGLASKLLLRLFTSPRSIAEIHDTRPHLKIPDPSQILPRCPHMKGNCLWNYTKILLLLHHNRDDGLGLEALVRCGNALHQDNAMIRFEVFTYGFSSFESAGGFDRPANCSTEAINQWILSDCIPIQLASQQFVLGSVRSTCYGHLRSW
jgi:hypothetical protein